MLLSYTHATLQCREYHNIQDNIDMNIYGNIFFFFLDFASYDSPCHMFVELLLLAMQ